MRMMNNKLILSLLKYFFLLLVLYYVGRFMYRSFGDLHAFNLKINYKYIALAYITHLIYLVSRALIWHYITVINKASIRLSEAIVVWFFSLLGKFIPGKVFYLGLRVYHYKQKGQSASAVTFSFFLEYMTGIASSILLFVLSFSLIPQTSFHVYRPLGVIISCTILAILHPKLLGPLLQAIRRILKRDIPGIESVAYIDILKITLLYFLSWGIMGLGFYFIVNSVYPLPFVDYPYVSGAFALATIIGILSLFAPSGIGVREGVIIGAMAQIIPTAIASVVAIIARIWATSSELFWVGVVCILSKVQKREPLRIRDVKDVVNEAL